MCKQGQLTHGSLLKSRQEATALSVKSGENGIHTERGAGRSWGSLVYTTQGGCVIENRGSISSALQAILLEVMKPGNTRSP